MCTISTPYKECDNPAQIYKKVIQGVKPQAFEKLDDPEVADFILSCIEYREFRPSARDLIESKFLKDQDSESNNYPVQIKSKHKLKSHKSTKEEGKKGMTVQTYPNLETKKEYEPNEPIPSPNPIVKKEEIDDVKLHKKVRRKERKVRKEMNEKNEKESLDLFNKIEAEKNQRLNINENTSTQEKEQEQEHKDEPNSNTAESHVSSITKDTGMNKSQDNILHDKLPHQSHPNPDPYEQERANISYEKHDNEPIENSHLHKLQQNELNRNLHTHTKECQNLHHSSKEQPKIKSQEEQKGTDKGIV